MEKISHMIFAVLMITYFKANASQIDELLNGCTQSSNFGECFVFCGKLNQAIDLLLLELDTLEMATKKELLKQEAHENYVATESLKAELRTLEEKKKNYLDKKERCYTNGLSKTELYDTAKDPSNSGNVLN